MKFIHGADFHLDSPFGALPAGLAAARRRESRDLPRRLSNYVNQNKVDLILLAGDLFDSANVFRETGEILAEALGQMEAEVFIAPGNHDWYGPGSPWTTVRWPENVRLFRENALTAVELPRWNLVVHGGAFIGPEQNSSLLAGFSAPEDGRRHFGLLHGEIDPPEERYNPIRREEVASSGLSYLALGHIHKRAEPFRIGKTLCAWPGCPEGRGFDELGEKGFYMGNLAEDGKISLEFIPFARRKYEIIEADVTGKDPQTVLETLLPEDAAQHLYRILLTGETGAGGVDAAALQEALADRCCALEIRDHTRMAEDVWARAGEDSLRGLFLQTLRRQLDQAEDEESRERVTQAARFGLAALDHRDLG